MTDLMHLTIEELENAIYAAAKEADWYYGGSFWGSLYYEDAKPFETSVGTVTVAETIDKGGEGYDGGYLHIVIKIGQDGLVRFLKKTGEYRSYEGSTFEGETTEVIPSTEKVMIYNLVAESDYAPTT